jgi:hypothetical protein
MSGFGNKQDEIQALFNKRVQIKEEQERASKTDKTVEAELADEVEVEVKATIEAPKQVTPFVGLNGITVRENGEITKTNYFNMLKVDEEQYSDIRFTEEEAKRVSMSMRHLTTGVNASVPMNCKGNDCPFATSCPYVKERKIPLGRPCLVEKQLIEYYTTQYMEEFDVDMDSLTEVYMVSELAEYNIYEKRVTERLAAEHQSLMQDVVATVDHTGAEIVNEEISRAWDLKERIKKSRMKVLEALMATRKDRVKLKVDGGGGSSAAEQMSGLKSKLEELKADISKMKPIDAETVDDYNQAERQSEQS